MKGFTGDLEHHQHCCVDVDVKRRGEKRLFFLLLIQVLSLARVPQDGSQPFRPGHDWVGRKKKNIRMRMSTSLADYTQAELKVANVDVQVQAVVADVSSLTAA